MDKLRNGRGLFEWESESIKSILKDAFKRLFLSLDEKLRKVAYLYCWLTNKLEVRGSCHSDYGNPVLVPSPKCSDKCTVK